jgi:hypothetical protein
MADLTGIGSVFDFGSKVIDKIWPNKAEADAAKIKLFELQQSGELQRLAAETELAKGQLQVNAVEAASASLFVAGWRPAVGWTCVVGLLYTFLLRPLLAWASGMIDIPVPPMLDMGDLFTLLAGMLGLGGMRTFEKIQGVASK